MAKSKKAARKTRKPKSIPSAYIASIVSRLSAAEAAIKSIQIKDSGCSRFADTFLGSIKLRESDTIAKLRSETSVLQSAKRKLESQVVELESRNRAMVREVEQLQDRTKLLTQANDGLAMQLQNADRIGGKNGQARYEVHVRHGDMAEGPFQSLDAARKRFDDMPYRDKVIVLVPTDTIKVKQVNHEPS